MLKYRLKLVLIGRLLSYLPASTLCRFFGMFEESHPDVLRGFYMFSFSVAS